MWTTESLWFEIAMVSIVFAVGNMVMGHFEERTPKLRRVGKYLIILTIVCGISVFFGRPASMIVLGAFYFRCYMYICTICQRKKALTVGQVSRRVSIMNFGSGTKIYFRNSQGFLARGHA